MSAFTRNWTPGNTYHVVPSVASSLNRNGSVYNHQISWVRDITTVSASTSILVMDMTDCQTSIHNECERLKPEEYIQPLVGEVPEGNWLISLGGCGWLRFKDTINMNESVVVTPSNWLAPKTVPEAPAGRTESLDTIKEPSLPECPKCKTKRHMTLDNYNHGCGVTRLDLIIAKILPDPYGPVNAKKV